MLNRLPSELIDRIKAIHFNDNGGGRRILGYTTTNGRREITLCAQPPRVSFFRVLVQRGEKKSPEDFGATRNYQWPPLAVRRLFLYNTLLHEIGHLQVIDPRAKTNRRMFADETMAEEFADNWREKLWSEEFLHPDPVHNRPSRVELDEVVEKWPAAHQAYKHGLIEVNRGRLSSALWHFNSCVNIYSHHSLAREELGIHTYSRLGQIEQAIGHLRIAYQVDPALPDTSTFLGIMYSLVGMAEKAEFHFKRALELTNQDAVVNSIYARHLLTCGDHDGSVSAINKALKKSAECPIVTYNAAMIGEIIGPLVKNLIHAQQIHARRLMASEARFGRESRGIKVYFRYPRNN